MNVQKRIGKAQTLVADRKLDALISTRYQSIGYISGVFQRWGTVMLVPLEGKPLLISSERRRVESEAWDPELIDFCDAQLVGEPENLPKGKVLANELKRRGLEDKRLGIEKGYISAAEMEQISALLPKVEWVEAGDLIPSLMLIKDAEEARALRRVAEIADAAMHEALNILEVGISELEVSGLVDLAVKRAGGEKTWFPTHVCSGQRADFDMAYPTDKLIQYNDRVVIDVGPMYKLYCGQLNTHVVVGEASSDDKKLFQAVADVHRKVIESLRVGVKASEVYQIAIEYAHRLGWPGCLSYFGRGIGIIDNEELLVFSPSCETTLAAGMAVATVTYIRDGHRTISTEQMVLIGENGAEKLTKYPFELLEV
jgi:Xaa-Pro aminopeptidase